jgi:hypothetical protein
MSRDLNSLLTRLERAGGDLSEAVGYANRAPEINPVLANLLVNVNIAIGDIRRAVVRVEHGDDQGETIAELRERQRELFE